MGAEFNYFNQFIPDIRSTLWLWKADILREYWPTENVIMVDHYKDDVLKDSIKRVKLSLPLSVHLCEAASKTSNYKIHSVNLRIGKISVVKGD